MKIGAFLQVKNESDVISQVINYHLETQGIDLIIVIDNGSTDNTVQIIRDLKDSRIILKRTSLETGHEQSHLSTIVTQELFIKHNCDWVVPIDSDEYWHSKTYGTLRKILENVPKPIHVLFAPEYRFFESEADCRDKEPFLRRLQYCRRTKQEKVIMYRLGNKIKEVTFGNHDLIYNDEIKEPVFFESKPEDLARFHYPHINKKDLIKRTLKQVEGLLIFSMGLWLKPEKSKVSQHIWNRYKLLKEGKLDEYYYNHLYFSNKDLKKGLKDGSIIHNSDMLHVISNEGVKKHVCK